MSDQFPGRRMPDDLPKEMREVYDRFVMPPKNVPLLRDVILSADNTAKYAKFMRERSKADKLREHGFEPINRILSYGYTGTGKTFSAKALARELDYTMIMVDISELAQGLVFENIAQIFRVANYLKYCVIFFDEVDAIAWNRDAGEGASGAERKGLNALFQYLDQMDDSNIFIAATNMHPRLDAAFKRRFNLHLEFTMPELTIREATAKFMKPAFNLVDDVKPSVERIIQRRARISYAEIEDIVLRAQKEALLNDTTTVYLSAIYEDARKVLRIRDRLSRSLEESDAKQAEGQQEELF